MKNIPRVGQEYTRSFVVKTEHLISFADDRMPAVLSTPQLIQQMEITAREFVAPLLEADERTVGTEVQIRHLAPTFEGAEVTCLARFLKEEDGELTFQVEARDGLDLLSRGLHRRHVVQVDRLRKRLERKRQQMS